MSRAFHHNFSQNIFLLCHQKHHFQVKQQYLKKNHSPIEDPGLLQHVSEVDVRVQEVRIERDRLLKVVDRQPDLALGVEHAAQVAPGHGKVRPGFDCLQVACLSLCVCYVNLMHLLCVFGTVLVFSFCMRIDGEMGFSLQFVGRGIWWRKKEQEKRNKRISAFLPTVLPGDTE